MNGRIHVRRIGSIREYVVSKGWAKRLKCDWKNCSEHFAEGDVVVSVRQGKKHYHPKCYESMFV